MVTHLTERIALVRANNPSPMTLEGTNTYVIGERAPVVLDPGPDDTEHLERVLDAAGAVSLVLLTHTHPDHAAGAERFASMARAPLAAHAGGTGTCATAAPVSDGQRIDVDGDELIALHTPGHASDHLCFGLGDVLFTGDHVLGRGTSVIAHPDGNMAAYMASLRRARDLGATTLYPGHGPVVENAREVLDYYIAHRIEREQQVIEAIGSGAGTVQDMVERIYADVDPALHPVAALSVRAHLDKLRDDATALEEDQRWRLV